MSKSVRDNEKLKQVTEILKRELSAVRLFLFGSRASGRAKSDSDYDFVIVTSDSRRPRAEKLRKVKAKLRELGIQADLFVYTEKLFKQWENEFSSIPETAKNTGRELSL